MNLKNKLKNLTRKGISLGLCLLTTAAFAQTPAVGTGAYDNWKMNQITSPVSAPTTTASINSAGTAPGCFFGADASYTTFPGNDDGSLGPIALGFNFVLYGVTYTSCYINNNGNITFNNPVFAFSSTGMPFAGEPMVAAFWGDVDTRPVTSGQAKYKVEAHRLIVSWDGVGYFPNQTDLLNTFQIIISDGLDPGIGLGNNVAFYYGDMQWTTGSASGGSGGFGGTPATAGINAGNGIDFVQIGRFDNATGTYDGGGGANDGINYLDYECFTFNASGTSGSANLPPSVSGAPSGNTITIPCGTTATLNLSFLPPEVAQTVSTLINTGGLCGTTINSNTSGAVSNTSVSIVGSACNAGTHHIIYTATDNAAIPASTVVDITVNITGCASVPTMSQWGLILLSLISLSFGMVFIYKKENAFAIAGQGSSSRRTSLFDKALYLKVLAVTLGFAVAALFAAYAYFGSITGLDTLGTIASASIVAFMAQLYMRLRNNEQN